MDDFLYSSFCYMFHVLFFATVIAESMEQNFPSSRRKDRQV